MSIPYHGARILTRVLTNVDVVVVALADLGGAVAPVDTEDLAIRAYELAPTRFSWTKHRQHINLELVRVALSDAKKPEAGALVAGTGSRGWHLTPAGVAAAQSAKRRVPDAGDVQTKVRVRRTKSVAQERASREEQHVITSTGWQKWLSGSRTVDLPDAEALFRVDVYADRRMIELKVNRMILAVGGTAGLEEFVRAAATRLLADTDAGKRRG